MLGIYNTIRWRNVNGYEKHFHHFIFLICYYEYINLLRFGLSVDAMTLLNRKLHVSIILYPT